MEIKLETKLYQCDKCHIGYLISSKRYWEEEVMFYENRCNNCNYIANLPISYPETKIKN